MSDHLKFDEEAARRLEAGYLHPRVAARRRRVLELLALKAGERVLDLGTGPGFFADEIAREVGHQGRVDALDRS